MSNASIRFSCNSRTKVRSHALLAGVVHALDNWRPLYAILIACNRFHFSEDSPSCAWHFIRSTLDIYWNFLLYQSSYQNFSTSALIPAPPTRMVFLFCHPIFQDCPGNTGRWRWLFQVHHVRCELHGGPVEWDHRGGSELANKGLLTWLGI